jgi:hypothetical protein
MMTSRDYKELDAATRATLRKATDEAGPGNPIVVGFLFYADVFRLKDFDYETRKEALQKGEFGTWQGHRIHIIKMPKEDDGHPRPLNRQGAT